MAKSLDWNLHCVQTSVVPFLILKGVFGLGSQTFLVFSWNLWSSLEIASLDFKNFQFQSFFNRIGA